MSPNAEYIVVPLTTGALMGKNQSQGKNKKVSMLLPSGELSSYFSAVCDDLFRKFDMLMGKELNYEEFAVFY